MIKTARQLKDLIRNLSKDKSADAQILMRNYMMERFLERISLSEYRDSLLDAYENFRMMEITGGDRDLTEKEEAKLAKERDALTALCEKEAAKCSS